MQNSNRLNLPFLMPGQGLKNITHNEALRQLDQIIYLYVIAILLAPPDGWAEGMPEPLGQFIVGDIPGEVWAGHAHEIAVWQDGMWDFLRPQNGWLCWNADTQSLWIFEDSNWKSVVTETLDTLGINMAADQTRRFSVRSDTSLFDNETADHRVMINRASPNDVASIVFQDDYSGRAEFGLSGTAGLSLRMSEDGQAYEDILRVAQDTGHISLLKDVFVEGNLRQNGNPVLDAENTFSPISDRGQISLGDDLNTYKSSGYWAQTDVTEPDIALNYPVEERGVLLVIRAWVMVFQLYFVIANASGGQGGSLYSRALFGTSWTAWKRLQMESDS